jgi:hypothetical protein
MKYIAIIFLAGLMLSGCANEAFYADQEFGMASQDAFDRQVVHKDYAYASLPDDGMDGLHAEKTMNLYHNSFGEGFTQESISVITTEF